MVPETVKRQVSAQKTAIENATVAVFAGPVADQDGKIRIAAGSSATDKELLGMTWFVKGVIGSTE
jgi:basic membrane protein A